MALLTKSQILAAEDLKYRTVQVPEWGGEVRVGSMTGLQRDHYDAAMLEARKSGDELSLVAALIAACVVGEDGNPIFTEDDVAALGRKSNVALRRVFDAALDLNVLSPAAMETQRGN